MGNLIRALQSANVLVDASIDISSVSLPFFGRDRLISPSLKGFAASAIFFFPYLRYARRWNRIFATNVRTQKNAPTNALRRQRRRSSEAPPLSHTSLLLSFSFQIFETTKFLNREPHTRQ